MGFGNGNPVELDHAAAQHRGGIQIRRFRKTTDEFGQCGDLGRLDVNEEETRRMRRQLILNFRFHAGLRQHNGSQQG